MSHEPFIKTAACAVYERLLESCQHNWKIWNERRAEIHQSGLRGRNIDDELRKLLAKYAKAYALLRNHGRDCKTCQWVSGIEGRSSGYAAGTFPENQLSA